VSEQSSTDAPGTAAVPEDEPVPAPAGSRRRRRRTILILTSAAVISVATIAVAVVWSVAYALPVPRYSRLPAPCTLISLAALDTYLPGATATMPMTSTMGTTRLGGCRWSSTSGADTRILGAAVQIFGAPDAITTAEQIFNANVSLFSCHCHGVAVNAQSVTGLGDQARVWYITDGPDADFVTAPNAQDPGASLVVRSSNALIVLNYNVIVTATETYLPPRADAAQLTALTSMARDILAALARPGASSGPSAPVAPEPHYAGRRDPCRLITAATLATYAPGATLSPVPNPPGSASASPQTNTCSWGTISGTNISLTLSIFADAPSAQQEFLTGLQSFSHGGAGTTVTAEQPLADPGAPADPGAQGVAIFQTQTGAQVVEILLWSGNAELEYSYQNPGGPSPSRAMLLAGGLEIARDALAALASPAASSYPQEPVYAGPPDSCALISASTVARYLPGAAASPTSESGPGPGPQSVGCGWTGINGVLDLTLYIYPDADSALGDYQFNVEPENQNLPGVTFRGEQPVKGLGQQATALFQASAGSTDVDLYILSGNAEIDLYFSPVLLGPQPSRAAMLAADIVMAREALAGLPR
jgi:hypothetical protein